MNIEKDKKGMYGYNLKKPKGCQKCLQLLFVHCIYNQKFYIYLFMAKESMKQKYMINNCCFTCATFELISSAQHSVNIFIVQMSSDQALQRKQKINK